MGIVLTMESGSVVTLEPEGTAREASRHLRRVEPAAVRPVAAQPVAPDSPPASAFDVTVAYDEHGSSLFGFALNMLRDRGLAEDCVQETFLRAWRARDRYDGSVASTRTWLFSIARNVIIDQQRSLQRTPRPVGADAIDDSIAAPPDDTLERLRMTQAIAALTPEHRQAVVEIHLNGSTYAELSESTGIPVGTLRSRTFYGLRALRDNLDEKGDQHD
ncbi:sigma-70 family RNA polymerase sigma factor [Marisediminicola senii]|uniref:sigma-70 family RNA polymerase sigma factor n=1 Tax=Marisediminicola senii TaxID=2711233 RepID=UPI00191153E9|nr:sigma-70 family RNA polymerase sigma factor [Marisediminicola senii]